MPYSDLPTPDRGRSGDLRKKLGDSTKSSEIPFFIFLIKVKQTLFLLGELAVYLKISCFFKLYLIIYNTEYKFVFFVYRLHSLVSEPKHTSTRVATSE